GCGLTGEIIARFERKGLRIVALRHMTMDRELAGRHYAEHEGKPFFGELVEFITSGPLVAMVLEGHEAVTAARQVIGATDPPEGVAHHNACAKALAVAEGHPDDLILGADTVVALDGRPYGKPSGPEEAEETLRVLSGHTHQVFGGIALVCGTDIRSRVVVTD